jgi:flavin reductase (DIM6/NTAB) family NADH-FMN oxidoreductase RutF
MNDRKEANAVDAFEALVGNLDYPMFVVTAAAGRELGGCLVGFATQCSLDPPRFLTCISKRNHTFRIAMRAETLVVHFLGKDDAEVAALFGENTSDETDKFAMCAWDPGPGGAPLVSACRGWVGGPIVDRVDLGDHVGFIIEPRAGESRDTKMRPLGFQAVRCLEPGHDA